jgi:hypothetical protein
MRRGVIAGTKLGARHSRGAGVAADLRAASLPRHRTTCHPACPDAGGERSEGPLFAFIATPWLQTCRTARFVRGSAHGFSRTAPRLASGLGAQFQRHRIVPVCHGKAGFQPRQQRHAPQRRAAPTSRRPFRRAVRLSPFPISLFPFPSFLIDNDSGD